jgi:hypothetical protein
LGHLQADGAAADHDQVIGPLGQVEDRLVGEVRRVSKARDRRHGRRGAGRDHEAAGPDTLPVRLDVAGRGEARLRLDHLDTEALETLHAVVGRDARDHVVEVAMHLEKVDRGLVAVDAEAPTRSHRVRGVGRRDERLGRHAARVEAVAAHAPALDEHDARAHLRRSGGDRQAARAGSDDAKVGADHARHGSSPTRKSVRVWSVLTPRPASARFL